ncbi:MAG TPA: alpha/beta hydrolase [Opitutus sp.]|nr:alpha/beta hydrolase [Opitutus sp.]
MLRLVTFPHRLAAFVAILAATSLGAADWGQPRGEPVVYKTVGDRALTLYVSRPDGAAAQEARPAIVFFHGGGWVGGSPAQLNDQAEHFTSRGLVCVLVQYRFAPRDETAAPEVCIQDARSAIRWVRRHAAELGVDPNRIAAMGASAGGHLAAHAALVAGIDDPHDDLSISSKPNALLLFNPVLDNGPGNYGASRVRDRLRELSPAHNVAAGAPPTILFLGTQDKLIPLATLARFRDALLAAGVPCELHLYEGQDHGFFNRSRSPEFYRLTVGECDRFLTQLGWLE